LNKFRTFVITSLDDSFLGLNNSLDLHGVRGLYFQKLTELVCFTLARGHIVKYLSQCCCFSWGPNPNLTVKEQVVAYMLAQVQLRWLLSASNKEEVLK